MRYLTPAALFASLLFALCGCGRTTSLNVGGNEGDSGPKGGFPGDYCAGATRAEINGVTPPVVDIQGHGHPQMSCCNELGRLVLRFPPEGGKTPFLQVTLALHAFQPLTTPLTMNLSKLPGDWYVLAEYFLCSNTSYGLCSRSEGLMDTLSSQTKDPFQGTLEVTGAGGGRRMSLCMMAGKGATAHPFLQQVKVWADGILIPK